MEEDTLDAGEELLSNYITKQGASFTYIYDFGDEWIHRIELEQIQTLDKTIKYPVCISGAMNCPPENCGGTYGYYENLAILKNPEDESYEEIKEWMGANYSPEHFDLIATNKQLQKTSRYLKKMYE